MADECKALVHVPQRPSWGPSQLSKLYRTVVYHLLIEKQNKKFYEEVSLWRGKR